MSFDLDALRSAVARHGRVARAVVAETRGSVPREVGAAMLVWATGQSGTIGGGALEWQAVARARETSTDRIDRLPLGPALGQCCGGAVSLVTEIYDDARIAFIAPPVVARPLPGQPDDPPLPVRRILARARDGRGSPVAGLVSGWMIEPVSGPVRDIVIWGAGHVGRAIAAVLAPLPTLRVTLIDHRPDELALAGNGIAIRHADPIQTALSAISDRAEHLVLTYSHALDLDLCHRLLSGGAPSVGLIGSATKRARFLGRLTALGHPPERLVRLRCPIGDPALGKHPQAIAVGVAAELLQRGTRQAVGDQEQSSTWSGMS